MFAFSDLENNEVIFCLSKTNGYILFRLMRRLYQVTFAFGLELTWQSRVSGLLQVFLSMSKYDLEPFKNDGLSFVVGLEKIDK